MRQRITSAFARHFNQTQLAEVAYGHACAVFAQRLVEFGQYRRAMLGIVHINEVNNDDAAQIAQAQLPRDGHRCFQVCFENRVVEVASAHVAACINVYRCECFCLIDNQIAPGFEVDAP